MVKLEQWQAVLAGGLVGGTIGYSAAVLFKKLKDREETEELDAWCKVEEEGDAYYDKVVEAIVDEKYSSDGEGDGILKMSGTAAQKWCERNGKAMIDALYFPGDEILGGWESIDGNFTFLDLGVEDVLASVIEDRRLTPDMAEAWYIYDGECYFVKVEAIHSFAEMFDLCNHLDVPAYPEE